MCIRHRCVTMVGMAAVVDHVFIRTERGAPGADRLTEQGLVEGSPNRHPGQGTACRRFFFQNAMLEFLWIEDAAEAQLEQNRRLDLWRRWSQGESPASPFGIILRPGPGTLSECPFPAWDYRPAAMPELQLKVANGTGRSDPFWGYLPTGRPPGDVPIDRRQRLEHPSGISHLTSVHLAGPLPDSPSVTDSMRRAGIVTLEASVVHRLELSFDGRRQAKLADFRPELPLVLRW